MPLPAGFKVIATTKGTSTKMPTPPRVLKTQAFLDKLPSDTVVTTLELCEHLRLTVNGALMNHPGLREYREKVDRSVFWGSRASIKRLRKRIVECEETRS